MTPMRGEGRDYQLAEAFAEDSSKTDFERGKETALWAGDKNAATTSEIKRAGGPNFMSGEATDESPDWHRGYDAGIYKLRKQ